jgi:hypothetical protein
MGLMVLVMHMIAPTALQKKKAYSKFGSYVLVMVHADGTFVYTGFKPAFVYS